MRCKEGKKTNCAANFISKETRRERTLRGGEPAQRAQEPPQNLFGRADRPHYRGVCACVCARAHVYVRVACSAPLSLFSPVKNGNKNCRHPVGLLQVFSERVCAQRLAQQIPHKGAQMLAGLLPGAKHCAPKEPGKAGPSWSSRCWRKQDRKQVNASDKITSGICGGGKAG